MEYIIYDTDSVKYHNCRILKFKGVIQNVCWV
jgi:hypothetical protein